MGRTSDAPERRSTRGDAIREAAEAARAAASYAAGGREVRRRPNQGNSKVWQATDRRAGGGARAAVDTSRTRRCWPGGRRQRGEGGRGLRPAGTGRRVGGLAGRHGVLGCSARSRPNGAGTVGNTPQAFSHFALIDPSCCSRRFVDLPQSGVIDCRALSK